ncbi:MFS transporter [Chloroflexota bacterium]
MSPETSQKNLYPAGNTGKGRFFYGWVVAVAGMIILFAHSSGNSSFGVFLKPLVDDLDASRASLSGAVSARFLMIGLLASLAGIACDKFGPRKVMLVSTFLCGLGYFLLSTTSALWQVYLYLGFLVGTGGSAFYTSVVATVARWFGTKSTRAMAVVTIGYSLGAIITPPLASYILTSYGWEAAFMALGFLIVFLCPLALIWLHPVPHESIIPPQFDSSLSLESTAVSTDDAASGADGLSLKEAVNTSAFWFIFGIFALHALSHQMLMTHLVANATDAGLEVTEAAFTLTCIGFSSLAGRLLVGILAYRFDSKSMLAFSLLITVPALLWLIVAKETWEFYIISTIFGLGSGAMTPLIPNITTVYFGNRVIGSLVGVQVFAYSVGVIIGPVLAGYVFDVTLSYSWAFAIAAMTMVTGFLFALILRPPQRVNSTNAA